MVQSHAEQSQLKILCSYTTLFSSQQVPQSSWSQSGGWQESAAPTSSINTHSTLRRPIVKLRLPQVLLGHMSQRVKVYSATQPRLRFHSNQLTLTVAAVTAVRSPWKGLQWIPLFCPLSPSVREASTCAPTT